ncbi:MAG TPA: hypothetical protein PKJ41_00430 [Bryobacteraceae bacterium]|nr:hypothetical protein [Bryobacteraceae bacterium]HPT25147.1 hypothetical protein [Bryobacteraceae bacterium]
MKLILRVFLLTMAWSASCLEGADEFAQYPAKVISARTGGSVAIERRGPDESRDAFVERAKSSSGVLPSFAGRYSVVLWSCGFVCAAGAIVDIETREFYRLPFVTAGDCGSVPGKLLDFRANSRLLIVRGRVGVADPAGKTFQESDCGVFKYVWTGVRFRQISAVFVK